MFVLDASVAIGWSLPDEHEPYSAKILELVETGKPIVPAIWPEEIANALLCAERRQRISAAGVQEAIRFIAGLRITVSPVVGVGELESRLALAKQFGLTVYDAAYLELAMNEHLPLATVDRRLLKAAREANVPVYLAESR